MTAKQYRDPATGQYGFWDDFDRLCECGHSLGVHVAGGFDCGTDPNGNKEPEAAGCQCQRFKPTGKRRVAVAASSVAPAEEPK